MKLQRLYSYVRQAISDYEMIKEGDKVALGISGGKDSLTLLYALAGLSHFYPQKFEVVGITIDLGYDGFDLEEISKLCDKLEVEHVVVKTQIKDMVHDGQCSLCARLRKGALLDKAKELGCNKIAYAHNLDDVVETMMMNLMYEGRFCSFWPITHFEDTQMDVIRPLIYVPVEEVIGFQHKMNLPVSKNPCPYDGITKRSQVREILRDLNKKSPGVKKRMMKAVTGSADWIQFLKQTNQMK